MTVIESKPASTGMPAPERRFSFQDEPGQLKVLFGGKPIVRFINEHITFRTFQIMDLRLRPEGPIEITSTLNVVLYDPMHLLACDWKCRVLGPLSVEVALTPSKLEGGMDKLLSEKRTYRISYLPAKDRFVYDIQVDLDFHEDIRGAEGLYHCPMRSWEGDDFAPLQFDQPFLSGGVGPQVPMTQDWEGMYEPRFFAEGFTRSWIKRFQNVMLETGIRGVRKIVFNRPINSVQKYFNLTRLRTAPRRPFIYAKTDGRYLRISLNFDYPGAHHICEWGYDQHWFALPPKQGDGLLFKKGQHIGIAYAIEDIEESEVPQEYLSAKVAEVEPEELAAADKPIYEEPICRFTTSAIDSPNGYAWRSRGPCVWNRTSGFEPGTGSLEIHNGDTAQDSVWAFANWGPSSACNPVPPLSRYEISAWVKADELDKVELTMKLVSYGGPAMFSPSKEDDYKDSPRTITDRRGDWVRIAFPAGPSGSLTMYGQFAFYYRGKGNAAISGVAIKRL